MYIEDLNLKLDHIGINEPNAEEAKKVTAFFQSVFGFCLRETPSAVFANEQIEVMKAPGRGQLGHFAISTSDLKMAQEYFEKQGIEFDEASSNYNDAGEKYVIYAKNEISGFAWHLIQKR